MKRLVAVMAALVLCAVGLGMVFVNQDSWHTPNRAVYVAYPSVQQVSNFGFMANAFTARQRAGMNPVLVFGSSELNPRPAGPTHPANLFREGRYGMDVMVMGRAFCTSLWQAIEVGAFSDRIETQPQEPKRVVIIPSIQWFMCYRSPRTDFPASFSQGAYRAFMRNEQIPRALKQRVTRRMAQYGVDRRGGPTVLADAVSTINRSVNGVVTDARLGVALQQGHAQLISANSRATPQKGAPLWDALLNEAELQAQRRAGDNPYGLRQSWYERSYAQWVEGAQKRWKVKGDRYFSKQEFQDFQMVLDVCKATGIEPLVLIQPVKGELYDKTIYTREVRNRYYSEIRAMCARSGVAVADFSGHEYDRYFLRDYSHPSEVGGVYYSRAIYSYMTTGTAQVE